jgi:hypothetical protein
MTEIAINNKIEIVINMALVTTGILLVLSVDIGLAILDLNLDLI